MHRVASTLQGCGPQPLRLEGTTVLRQRAWCCKLSARSRYILRETPAPLTACATSLCTPLRWCRRRGRRKSAALSKAAAGTCAHAGQRAARSCSAPTTKVAHRGGTGAAASRYRAPCFISHPERSGLRQNSTSVSTLRPKSDIPTSTGRRTYYANFRGCEYMLRPSSVADGCPVCMILNGAALLGAVCASAGVYVTQ